MANWDFCDECNGGNNCTTHFGGGSITPTIRELSIKDLKAELKRRTKKPTKKKVK